jgi:hypothetical protein
MYGTDKCLVSTLYGHFVSGLGCDITEVFAERRVIDEALDKPRSVHVCPSNTAALKIDKYYKQLDVRQGVRS